MNLTIRKMNKNNLEPLALLLADLRVMQHLEKPYSKAKAERFLENSGLCEPPLIYAVDEDGKFIGYVIFHDYDEYSIEIGWVLNSSLWGRGCASLLTEQMIEMAFSSKKHVVIECSPQQNITRHIAEKYGFAYTGNIDGLDVFRLYCNPS